MMNPQVKMDIFCSVFTIIQHQLGPFFLVVMIVSVVHIQEKAFTKEDELILIKYHTYNTSQ